LKITDLAITTPLYLDLVSQGDARQNISGPRANVFVLVETDDGITGICPASPTPDLNSFILDVFKPQVVGEDPFEVERIWDKLYWWNYGSVRRGTGMRALSCIDIAIWDIIGKVCRQPIHRLLGGYRKKVPAYGSGINLPLPIDELVKQNRMFLEMGFKMVKMKIGQRDKNEDLKRIKAVRDALGYDVDLAVDANNMYGVNTAITMAKKMERYDIYWFEEPVLLDNIEGIVKLAGSTSIPIAGYELENTKYGFKELIARGGIGICQADATICGGITEFRKIAALAECYGIPMAPHGVDQLHVPLTAAIPNGLIVEWMYALGARTAELMDNPIVPTNGEMECKMEPGLGIEISKEAIKKYSAKPNKMGAWQLNPRNQWPPYA
jgi:L-alanine-DL-glutamate epimerase-like enolase superfamily enzyme